MSVSGNSVSYRLLLLSLLLTPFLFSKSNALTTKYSCLKHKDQGVIAFFVEKASKETVDKILAKDKESDCSTPSPMVGAGTAADPYSFTIKADKFTACGVKKAGNDYSVTFIIKSEPGKYAAATEVDVKCDFTKVKIDAEVNSNVKFAKETASEETPAVTMNFAGSPSSLTVGSDTSLELKLTNKNGFKGIKPYICWAKKTQAETGEKILDNYCKMSGAPIDLVFAPDDTDKTISKSEKFKAFRFFDSATLFITCQVDVCVDAANCAKDACTARKKRSVSDTNDKPNRLVTTNASIVVRGKGSSLL